jgi:hypothetical protein
LIIAAAWQLGQHLPFTSAVSSAISFAALGMARMHSARDRAAVVVEDYEFRFGCHRRAAVL